MTCEIATDDAYPRAIWEGSFPLGSRRIGCAVLDNGQRIVTQEGVREFMLWLHDTKDATSPEEVDAFVRWTRGEA